MTQRAQYKTTLQAMLDEDKKLFDNVVKEIEKVSKLDLTKVADEKQVAYMGAQATRATPDPSLEDPEKTEEEPATRAAEKQKSVDVFKLAKAIKDLREAVKKFDKK